MDDDLENKIAQIVGALKGQFSSGETEEDEGNKGEESAQSDNNSGDFEMPDDSLKMMMKMKRVLDQQKTGQNDPAKNLLNAIKPFLKESRQERVGNCIKFLGMSKMLQYTDLFGDN